MGLLFTGRKVFNSSTNDYSTTINVDNKLSPEAVDQAEKIREKVLSNIVGNCVVQDNIVNGLLFAYHGKDVSMDDSFDLFLKFKINGKEYSPRLKMDGLSFKTRFNSGTFNSSVDHVKREIVQEIAHKLGEYLAIELIKDSTF